MSYVAKANIFFDPQNMFRNQPTMRQSIIDKVHAFQGPAGAVSAVVV